MKKFAQYYDCTLHGNFKVSTRVRYLKDTSLSYATELRVKRPPSLYIPISPILTPTRLVVLRTNQWNASRTLIKYTEHCPYAQSQRRSSTSTGIINNINIVKGNKTTTAATNWKNTYLNTKTGMPFL